MALYFQGWGPNFLGWEGEAVAVAAPASGGGSRKKATDAAIAYNRRVRAERVAQDDAEILMALSQIMGAVVNEG